MLSASNQILTAAYFETPSEPSIAPVMVAAIYSASFLRYSGNSLGQKTAQEHLIAVLRRHGMLLYRLADQIVYRLVDVVVEVPRKLRAAYRMHYVMQNIMICQRMQIKVCPKSICNL